MLDLNGQISHMSKKASPLSLINKPSTSKNALLSSHKVSSNNTIQNMVLFKLRTYNNKHKKLWSLNLEQNPKGTNKNSLFSLRSRLNNTENVWVPNFKSNSSCRTTVLSLNFRSKAATP